ncbi:MAG: hypothetical protein CME62_12225 [Halobacteriovoraceae bacterium]|nr:hypothetical protein [Halobacteriovoraceae bacterium]|tara:strand:- start:3085 stop:3528 length:444 start_codon:yes stop_codon:yes gene_type:complete
MKIQLSVLLILTSFLSFAHDEGHGPALKDESMNGGKVAAIISALDVKKGRKAEMLYKGELVHDSRDLSTKVYIYDTNMKAIDLSSFAGEMQAVQIERGKEKTFTLKKDKSGKFYQGARPKNKRVPFNIDIRVLNGDKALFGAFDGLD